MSRLFRITILAGVAVLLSWLWYAGWPELFRAGMPSITEDADFALLVRLTGFVIIISVAFYFAARNIPRR
ncbi:MAG TPA: hypothetical protein VFG28_14280 [Syntrophales bacterium]|nr:hypothetical protein [Syntrophales bacterium]